MTLVRRWLLSSDLAPWYRVVHGVLPPASRRRPSRGRHGGAARAGPGHHRAEHEHVAVGERLVSGIGIRAPRWPRRAEKDGTEDRRGARLKDQARHTPARSAER